MQQISYLEKRKEDIIAWFKDELTKIRTDRANPSFLDLIKVEAYGSLTPLNQVSTITTEDARTLRVSPWDLSLVKQVESTIQKSDLGVSVSSDEKGVRIHFPELTSESRGRIAKTAKQKHEEARITLRSERDKVRQELQSLEKDGSLSEDEKKRLLDNVEKLMGETNKILDEMYENKYQELKTV